VAASGTPAGYARRRRRQAEFRAPPCSLTHVVAVQLTDFGHRLDRTHQLVLDGEERGEVLSRVREMHEHSVIVHSSSLA